MAAEGPGHARQGRGVLPLQRPRHHQGTQPRYLALFNIHSGLPVSSALSGTQQWPRESSSSGRANVFHACAQRAWR